MDAASRAGALEQLPRPGADVPRTAHRRDDPTSVGTSPASSSAASPVLSAMRGSGACVIRGGNLYGLLVLGAENTRVERTMTTYPCPICAYNFRLWLVLLAGVAVPIPVEWRCCQRTHCVLTRPHPLGELIDPGAVAVVCGTCPPPRRGLALRCCTCREPLTAWQGNRRLRPVR